MKIMRVIVAGGGIGGRLRHTVQHEEGTGGNAHDGHPDAAVDELRF